MTAIELIQQRRAHQLSKDHTAAKDDGHTKSELAHAAAFLCLDPKSTDLTTGDFEATIEKLWPENWRIVSPANRIEELAIAGALVIAEIERLQRLQAKAAEQARVTSIAPAPDQ